MNETTTSKSDYGAGVRAMLKEEIEKGGSLSPCPFCAIPRVQRGDYVRCCKCGINWDQGENLSKDPKIERFQKMVASAPKSLRKGD